MPIVPRRATRVFAFVVCRFFGRRGRGGSVPSKKQMKMQCSGEGTVREGSWPRAASTHRLRKIQLRVWNHARNHCQILAEPGLVREIIRGRIRHAECEDGPAGPCELDRQPNGLSVLPCQQQRQASSSRVCQTTCSQRNDGGGALDGARTWPTISSTMSAPRPPVAAATAATAPLGSTASAHPICSRTASAHSTAVAFFTRLQLMRLCCCCRRADSLLEPLRRHTWIDTFRLGSTGSIPMMCLAPIILSIAW